MKAFVQRMHDELEALEEKIDKLHTFTLSDNFNDLSEKAQILLTTQLSAMSTYYGVLTMRIDLYQE